MSYSEEKSSRRSELKKLHFEKTQELKRAKSRAEKDQIELKYKELEKGHISGNTQLDDSASAIFLPESLYTEQKEPSRSQAKKEAKQAKEAARRAEIVSQVGDGSIEVELALNERKQIESRIPEEFEIKQVPADGECMYASIILQLGGSLTCNDLRNSVADFLESHEEEYKLFLDEDFNEYCSGVRSSTWGSEIELQVISRIYNRCITVYTSEGIIPISQGEEPPIRLSFHLRQYSSPHYNAVV
jgi:hypothetical protein